jgi:hypothetical protein
MVDVWAQRGVPKHPPSPCRRGHWPDLAAIGHSMYMNGADPPNDRGDSYRDWRVLLSVQSGIVDRSQALRVGFSRRQIAHRLDKGVWKRVHPGVYATFTGSLPREAQLWAAVLCAGSGAMVSHETAAEAHGIIDRPVSANIHVTVPLHRRPTATRPIRGIVIHRSGQTQQQVVGPFALPRSGVEHTILDLIAASSTFDQAYGWITRAVSRQHTTADRLRAALATRRRVRWRQWLDDALEDADDGVHSALERRYARDVEKAHGLPRSQHQARRQLGGRLHYRDNWYAEHRVVVEIDGPAFHQNERVQLDKDRDNINLALDDIRTHRFGPVGVTEQACLTAALVAATLHRNGWHGSPHPCRRPGCVIRSRRT